MTKNQIDKLVTKFTEASKKHHDAIMSSNSRIANIQAKRILKIFSEIEKIGEDAMDSLLEQTSNVDHSIALMASVYSLRHNPQKALSTLMMISKMPGMLGFRAQQAI